MYKCLDCGKEFEEPRRYIERHGFEYPPYEEWYGCPFCAGDYDEVKEDDDEEGEEDDELD